MNLTGSLKEMLVSDHAPQTGKTTKDNIHPSLKAQWTGKYWQVLDGSDLLQDTEAATLSLRFKLGASAFDMQDLVAFSVGSEASSNTSRLSLRLHMGQITAILRAGDKDAAQEYVTTGAALRADQWHTLTLVVNYAKNTAGIYLDGHKLEAVGGLKFSQKKTAPTPSASMSYGSEDDGSNFFFQGKIARVLVWRRELSREEIIQLH